MLNQAGYREGVRSRGALRAFVARGLGVSGLGALLRRMTPWHGVVVLSYHRIGDGRESELFRGAWTVSEALLQEQLRLLERQFEIVEPEDVRSALLTGPGRRVMITFDDAYRDLYEVAYPVLEANGMRATLFVCSGFIDGLASAWWDEIAWMIHRSSMSALPPGPWCAETLPLDETGKERAIEIVVARYRELDPLGASQFLTDLGSMTGTGRRPAGADSGDWITWSMAREMQASGHQIGAHTVTHPVLSRLPKEQQYEEVIGSVRRIENELGERPRWFAYPVGGRDTFNEDSVAAVREAGIELAFTNYGGRVRRPDYSAFDVHRVPVETLRSRSLFSATVTVPLLFA